MQHVRVPAVAGTFYPESPEELARDVAQLLAAAKPSGPRPKALIVPHAGYIYSGPIAATAFAQIAPYASQIERVVLLGPAHREFVDGLAWPDAARLATPLGEIEVDVAAIEQLGIAGNARAHAREHSLEVMLPFVQQLMPQAPGTRESSRVKVIPLIGSRQPPEQVGRVLEALWGGPETLIIISSDLSHHLPYAVAQQRDAETAARILALDTTLAGDDACGSIGIAGLAWLAKKKGLSVKQLDVRNSGDTAGSRDRVVGYGAFAFYEAA